MEPTMIYYDPAQSGVNITIGKGWPLLLPSGLSWTDVEPGRTAVWIRRGERAV